MDYEYSLINMQREYKKLTTVFSVWYILLGLFKYNSYKFQVPFQPRSQGFSLGALGTRSRYTNLSRRSIFAYLARFNL